VAAAGDVNGDGYGDVLIGEPYYDTDGIGDGDGNSLPWDEDQGRVLLYYGGAGGVSLTPAWTAVGSQFQENFGFSVGSAGNVNGDAFGDVIVGAPHYANGQANEGRVLVYHGSATGFPVAANWSAESDQGNAQFGASVAGAGDVNGDGYGDVVVGAPRYYVSAGYDGRVSVYYGSGSGLGGGTHLNLPSSSLPDNFGFSVAGAGDVNGDGYADILVGATRLGQAAGGAAVLF